jgi:hypothetical protein
MLVSWRTLASTLMLLLLSANTFGADLARARAVFDEGKKMLKTARAAGGDVINGSHAAIEKFEEAAALLKGAPEGSPEAELLQDINSNIYWARKTTPIDIRSMLKESGGSPGSGHSSAAASSASSSAAEPATPRSSNPAEAAAALARAEAYAQSHQDDPETCAARFFEVADRFKDVHDVAFKAISRVQEIQRLAKERKALREAEAGFGALPQDEKLVVEGDRAYAVRDFDQAAAKYRQAIGMKRTADRHRKLGHAMFERAQQLRGDYTRAYLEGLNNYRLAQSRGDRGGMQRALAENARASTISKDAIAHYERAEAAFRAAWDACGRLDLDSELHMALTFVVRKQSRHLTRAKEILERILFNYHDKLVTDEERTLYAYAETYAGPALVATVRKQIARKAAASSGPGGRGGEARGGGEVAESLDDEPSPREMSDDELKKAIAEVEAASKKDQHRLQAYQATGRFDKELLDRVNAESERLKDLEREAERRGIR